MMGKACLVVLAATACLACSEDPAGSSSGTGHGGSGASSTTAGGNGGDGTGGNGGGGTGGGTGGTVALVFASDWGTETGNSLVAVTDDSAWDNTYCTTLGDTLEVIEGSRVGWTKTANVLRIQQLGETCGMLEKTNAVPVSTTHWGRFYFRNDETASTHNHVATYFPVGDIQVALWNRQGSPAGLSVFLRTYYAEDGSGTMYPTYLWSAGTDALSNGVWYRYEWMMEYVTPTTYRIHPRIYDLDGRLLFDEANFFQADYPQSGSDSLATWYAADLAFGFSDVALARNVGIGNEGPAGSASTGGYWYHADYAVSLEGWIGP